jgi:hypothetical protein
MKSLINWLNKETTSNRLSTTKPKYLPSHNPEYEMGYYLIRNEIVPYVTDGVSIWYDTSVMDGLGYSLYDVSDYYLLKFGGRYNIRNCGRPKGSFAQVREIVVPDQIIQIGEKELYNMALHCVYSEAQYKKPSSTICSNKEI